MSTRRSFCPWLGGRVAVLFASPLLIFAVVILAAELGHLRRGNPPSSTVPRLNTGRPLPPRVVRSRSSPVSFCSPPELFSITIGVVAGNARDDVVVVVDLHEDHALAGARQEVHVLRVAAQRAALVGERADVVVGVDLERGDDLVAFARARVHAAAARRGLAVRPTA